MGLLKERAAIITGGTAGIGREIALTFVKEGAHVAILGTNEVRAQDAVTMLQDACIAQGQKIEYRIADVSCKEDTVGAINSIIECFGGCDILINNAGITRDTLLMKMTEEEWDQVLDTNLKSVYHTSQAVIRGMIRSRYGKIINISSVVALVGNPGQTNYVSAKAGMIGFSKALALEVASRGICVNCIAPGFIRTKMTDVLTESQKEHILKKIPMGRLGCCEDIAQAALFLAGPYSHYITGQVLTVDGGMVM